MIAENRNDNNGFKKGSIKMKSKVLWKRALAGLLTMALAIPTGFSVSTESAAATVYYSSIDSSKAASALSGSGGIPVKIGEGATLKYGPSGQVVSNEYGYASYNAYFSGFDNDTFTYGTAYALTPPTGKQLLGVGWKKNTSGELHTSMYFNNWQRIRLHPNYISSPRSQGYINGGSMSNVEGIEFLWANGVWNVSFDNQGGEEGPDATTLTYNEAYADLNRVPTKAHYIFNGYYTETNGQGTKIFDKNGKAFLSKSPLAKDTTLYASWTPEKYTVTLDAGEGTFSSLGTPRTTKDVYYERTYGTLAVPVRTGYAFTGWIYNGKTVTSSTQVTATGNHTLYATWKACSVAINFDVNGGTMDGDLYKTVTYDSPYGTLPTPTKRGYTFDGWYLNNTKISSTDICKLTKTAVLTAKYTINQYDVTYIDECHGTTLKTTTKSINYGTVVRGADLGTSDKIGAYVSNMKYVSDSGELTVTDDNSSNVVYRYFDSYEGAGLNGFYIRDGVLTSDGNADARSVVLPKDVVTIGSGAFENCSNLQNLTIPYHVTTIESNAFSGVPSMTITVANPECNIEEGAIPSYVKLVSFAGSTTESYAEENYSTFEYLTTIPKGFYQGESLTSFTVPEHVTTIEEDAFADCTQLKEIDFSDVEVIKDRAFQNTAIKDLVLPATVKTIGTNAFANISSLKNLYLDEGSALETIGDYAFRGNALQKVTLPNSVKTVGKMAFFGCENLSVLDVSSMETTFSTNSVPNTTTMECYYKSKAYDYAKETDHDIILKALLLLMTLVILLK